MATTDPIDTIAYVVHDANESFKLEDVTLTDMKPDELLIDMKYSGICHTDLLMQTGAIRACQYPAIFGHEGAGTIRAIGSSVKNKDLKVGDFVLLSINFCEKCRFCLRGHPADCLHGTRLHLFGTRDDKSTAAKLKGKEEEVRSHFFGQSSFAKSSFVHETCVVKHPYKAEDAGIFAAMGCGYQTGAGTVLNVLKPENDSSIVIFGLGTVGLTALMAAKYLGLKQIIAIDIQESKFPLAKELGATDVANPKEITDMAEYIKKLTDGVGADYCIDCSGNLAVIESMLNCLANKGTAATVGVPPSGAKISVDPQAFLLGSKTYIGCREGDSVPTEFIPKLVEMQRQGEFPVEKLCKVYNYRDLEQALDDMHHGKTIKPVIQWS